MSDGAASASGGPTPKKRKRQIKVKFGEARPELCANRGPLRSSLSISAVQAATETTDLCGLETRGHLGVLPQFREDNTNGLARVSLRGG